MSTWKLGQTSARYESNGNPLTVSGGVGDRGGVSYGSYQLSSKVGTADKFVQEFYPTEFAGLTAGSTAFSDKWRALNPMTLSNNEHRYIKREYYDRVLSLLKIDDARLSPAEQDMLWSTAVHMGPGYLPRIIKGSELGNGVLTGLAKVQLHKYNNALRDFRSSSAAWQQGNKRRAWQEWCDLMALDNSPLVPLIPRTTVVKGSCSLATAHLIADIFAIRVEVGNRENVQPARAGEIIKQFQQQVGLLADGIAGPDTWELIAVAWMEDIDAGK